MGLTNFGDMCDSKRTMQQQFHFASLPARATLEVPCTGAMSDRGVRFAKQASSLTFTATNTVDKLSMVESVAVRLPSLSPPLQKLLQSSRKNAAQNAAPASRSKALGIVKQSGPNLTEGLSNGVGGAHQRRFRPTRKGAAAVSVVQQGVLQWSHWQIRRSIPGKHPRQGKPG